jgi:hypothetical protein
VSKAVTEYQGAKYSLQPHGLKSKLLGLFAAFVVAFGGALLAASPAQASVGEVSCVVEVSPADLTTTPTTTAVVSPTPCSPALTLPPVTITTTVTVTITGPKVFVTKTETKTAYVTEEVTATTKSAIPVSSVPAPPTTPKPSYTPPPLETSPASSGSDASSLTTVGIVMASIGGTALLGIGVIGMTRRRYQGAHHAGSDTQVMPIVSPDEHTVSDYSPSAGEYDPALGGHAGETYQRSQETVELPPTE